MNERKRAKATAREREIRRIVDRLAGDRERIRELVDFLLEVTSAAFDAGAGTEEAVPAFIRRQGERVRELEAQIQAAPPVVSDSAPTATSGS